MEIVVDHVSEHRPQPPQERSATDGNGRPRVTFFPGEAAQLLGLRERGRSIDYAQLRRLFKFVRTELGETDPSKRAWSRWTFTDVVAARRVVALSGGSSVFEPGRRLDLRGVGQACDRLRQLGYSQPLLTVPLIRVGGTILAVQHGIAHNDAGQLHLAGIESDVAGILNHEGADVLDLVRTEYDRLSALESEVSTPDRTLLPVDALLHEVTGSSSA